jgi:transcriptional regulator with GAF, ATPase, and Fis domain
MSADADGQLAMFAAELVRARGTGIFPDLARLLSGLLEADEARICAVAPNFSTTTIGVWRGGRAAANFVYTLAGTPCAEVLTGKTLAGAIDRSRFPAFAAEYAGYFGMPLTANDGAALGHLCAFAKQPIALSARTRAFCDILAVRAAAELRLSHVKRERALLRDHKQRLLMEISAHHPVDSFAGASAGHRRVLDEIRLVAPLKATVLVSGEPGTGKDLVARAIHARGPRSTKPFAVIACAALSIDEELDTLVTRLPLIDGGTLFLDEVGALSPEMQKKLRSTLGMLGPSAPDVRIVAATNRDLHGATARGDFDVDLHAMLTAFVIRIPPLRTRVEDIAPLVEVFVRRHAQRLGRHIADIDAESLAELQRYSWPGNARELEHLVERALVTADGPVLKISTDPLAITSPTERAALVAATTAIDLDDTMATGLHAVQREHILRVLNATQWVIEGSSGAALKLEMKPATLRHRMKKLGISRALNPSSSRPLDR